MPYRLQIFSNKRSTLVYLIDVGVRLLNSWQNSSHYPLIPYPTFINFEGNGHPIQLLHPICLLELDENPIFTHTYWTFSKFWYLSSLFSFLCFFFNSWKCCRSFFPHTISHPMRLLHPLCLLTLQGFSIQYVYSIPYVYHFFRDFPPNTIIPSPPCIR